MDPEQPEHEKNCKTWGLGVGQKCNWRESGEEQQQRREKGLGAGIEEGDQESWTRLPWRDCCILREEMKRQGRGGKQGSSASC